MTYPNVKISISYYKRLDHFKVSLEYCQYEGSVAKKILFVNICPCFDEDVYYFRVVSEDCGNKGCRALVVLKVN